MTTDDIRAEQDAQSTEHPKFTACMLVAAPTQNPTEWIVRPLDDSTADKAAGIAAIACIRLESAGLFLYPSLPGFVRSGPFETTEDALVDLAEHLTAAGLPPGLRSPQAEDDGPEEPDMSEAA
jgi:hypothetical protein